MGGAVVNNYTLPFLADGLGPIPEPATLSLLALGALLRQLAGVKAWYLLTHEHDLDTAEASAIVGWAIEQFVRALRDGNFPSMERDAEQTS